MERIRQLDAEIAAATSDLLGSVVVQPQVVELAAPEVAPDHEIFRTLWTLKAGFQQVDSLITEDNFAAALSALQELHHQIELLAKSYPKSLLVIDCERQHNERKAAIASKVENLWNNSVKFSGQSLELGETDHSLVTSHFLHLENELIEKIGSMFIEPLLQRDITVVANHENATTTIKALPERPQTIPGFLDSVKQLVTGFDTTFIGSRISQRYSRSFVDQLVCRTLPEMLTSTKLGKDDFDSVLEQLRGVEAMFERTGWARGHDFADLSRDFKAAWKRSLEAHYLDELRSVLKGNLVLSEELGDPPKGDDWDWNSDDEDQDRAPEPQSADGTDPEALIASIVSIRDGLASEVPDKQAQVLFAELYRALAPQYYGKYTLLLYYHASKLASDSSMERFAQHQLGSALQSYSDTMEAIILQLNILPGELPNNAAAAEIKQGVATIAEDVAQQSGFSADMRETVLSSIVEQIAAEVIGAVEALPVIGESQSQQISLCIAHLNGLSAYFVNVEQAVPSWVKLQSLEKLLTANLASIRQMLGDAQLIDFSSEELTMLINALFEDSENRRSLIRDVKSTL